jgi:hypothetical protein
MNICCVVFEAMAAQNISQSPVRPPRILTFHHSSTRVLGPVDVVGGFKRTFGVVVARVERDPVLQLHSRVVRALHVVDGLRDEAEAEFGVVE